jgi:hypothetical protein
VCTYFLFNHYLSIGYFFIHRYIERHRQRTWAIADGLASFDADTGQHDIASKSVTLCYLRGLYFVISTLTSIGYGDVAPYTDLEFGYQIFIALCGTCLNAMMCQSLSLYLNYLEASGYYQLQEHIHHLSKYVKLRNISGSIQNEIYTYCNYIWKKERNLGSLENSFKTRYLFN